VPSGSSQKFFVKLFLYNWLRISRQDWHALGVREGVSNRSNNPQLSSIMLSWSVTFLIIALIAAALGFGGIAGTAVGIAKVLFFVFLVLFIVSLLVGRKPSV
jgi:uncharacterized membrane protein YtjA (UPF0391 family)